MALQAEGIELLEAPPQETEGLPLQIAVGLIDEDPNQPRTEFDPARLDELTQSITVRGVLQPVSVRPHPEANGRWILNFGARRLRATKRAGKPTIPAYVDRKADRYDQVIENEQRESMKPLELALFVQRQLAAGQTQAEIARRLGKSRTFITMVCALINAPDWLMTVYRQGKCRSPSDIYELRRLHEAAPDVVTRWLAQRETVTRQDLATLKATLAPPADAAPVVAARSPGPIEFAALAPAPRVEAACDQPSGRALDSRAAGNSARPGLRLFGSVGGSRVEVLLDRMPGLAQGVFVRALDGGVRSAAVSAVSELSMERG